MCNRFKGLHCVTELQSGAEHTIDTRQTAHIVMSSVDSDVDSHMLGITVAVPTFKASTFAQHKG